MSNFNELASLHAAHPVPPYSIQISVISIQNTYGAGVQLAVFSLLYIGSFLFRVHCLVSVLKIYTKLSLNAHPFKRPVRYDAALNPALEVVLVSKKFRPYVMEVILGLFLIFSVGPILESGGFAQAKNHEKKHSEKESKVPLGRTRTVNDGTKAMPHSETKSPYTSESAQPSESIGDHSKDSTSKANREKSNKK